MKKLIPMTDFVLEQSEKKQSTSEFKEAVIKYANFIKLPLNLSMFLPTDDEGNVLQEPEPIYEQQTLYEDAEPSYDVEEVENYKKAIEKVIFDGFELTTAINKLCFTKQNIKIIFIKEKAKDFINTNVFLENLLTNQILEIKTIEDLVQFNLQIKNIVL